MEDVQSAIDDFVTEYFLNYLPPESERVRDDKVIHDTLWGTHLYKTYEIALLDTPLLQRLRQIRQTALTFLTYPSTVHTRFEHTLGVVYQCDKLTEVLRKKYGDQDCIGKESIIDLRLAALLHDCGHGPFSHTSEEIYRYLPDMQRLISRGGPYEGKNPHEVLSHLIVMSDKFKEGMLELKKMYGFNCNLEKVANYILGSGADEEKYITHVLNGPFDADKLDYIFRDGHFSGLPLKVDLDRLWYAVEIEWKDSRRILSLNNNAISPLEQILFCKIILFSTIYHHHKVRAADCMLKSVIEYMKNNDKKFRLPDRDILPEKATDFLWLSDNTVFNKAHLTEDDELHKLIHNLLYRRLFKRALMISPFTVVKNENDDLPQGYQDLQKLNQKLIICQDKLKELAHKIWDLAGKPCLREEIWVDLPSFPPTGETDETYIKCPSEADGDKELIKLSKIFPVHEWVKMYTNHKWRGHVFCPPRCINDINKAATQVIQEEFDFEFNHLATKLCHIDD